MNLEEEINKIIATINTHCNPKPKGIAGRLVLQQLQAQDVWPIENWKWEDQMDQASTQEIYWSKRKYKDPKLNAVYISKLVQIHGLIESTPAELCLTSPAKYIREYRKWYEKNKDK